MKKQNKKQWVDSRGDFSFREIPDVHNSLPPGVYELEYDSFMGSFFLRKIMDDFILPPKIYGLEKELIERVITTFAKLDKNFGVLLKGLKGTGKTIASKIICNRLGIPVILVNKPWSNIGNFINSIDQDVVLLFDEFEKTYEFSSYSSDDDDGETTVEEGKITKQNVNSLLTLMDGVFTSKHKRLFLLTTNKDWLPDPMIARPSRIRYIKDFNDLSTEGITEILTDSVKNKSLIPDLAKLLKGLEIITVDIVKSVAEEANIYDTADPEFFSIFNVKKQKRRWDIYEIKGKAEKLLSSDENIDPSNFRKGVNIYIDGGHDYVGSVIEANHDKNIYKVKDSRDGKKIVKTLLFKKSLKGHTSMHSFAYSEYEPMGAL